jgi:hypothetical protein
MYYAPVTVHFIECFEGPQDLVITMVPISGLADLDLFLWSVADTACIAASMERGPGMIELIFAPGLPPGQYEAGGSWGRIQIDGPNNGARMVDRGMGLAGSALTPIDGFRNAIRLFNKSIGVASRLWSRNPARLLGLNKGEIAPGRDADLILLDEYLELRYTIVAGQIVFQKTED